MSTKLDPKDKAQRVQLTMSPPVLALADARAAEAGETRSAYLARLVQEDAAMFHVKHR